MQGIISIGDVVKSRVTQLENEARAMEEYLHHGRRAAAVGGAGHDGGGAG